ncbi:Uncharacterized protein dnl_34680 [Desulfonema limicola]|uniref:Uncharacterized protein n=1 Tax=Desulfonema limicola TaxID=45656 RepID=A0A975B8V9_9BACT|nr:Uncharacterized protein dnl_34680 [Desulfonema limicola]
MRHEVADFIVNSFAEKHGILWSARQEFDELLEYLGLRKLPDL